MNRMLKFRAWDEELNRMYCGDEIEAREELNAWLSYGELAIYRINDGEYTELKPLQYTGLDDRNGREIYEGDIVKIKGHAFEGAIKIDGIYEVGYNDRMELCCGSWLLHRELPYVTVIGNKYQNPELLRGGGSGEQTNQI